MDIFTSMLSSNRSDLLTGEGICEFRWMNTLHELYAACNSFTFVYVFVVIHICVMYLFMHYHGSLQTFCCQYSQINKDITILFLSNQA